MHEPEQIVVSSPIITATGTLQFTATAPIVPRTWEEEEAAEKVQASALSEEWAERAGSSGEGTMDAARGWLTIPIAIGPW
jgi:hypothetical protein